ncbi:MAG: folate-binding protein YgfZ [Proteobacteria bacterium]|nr:folate-binding protein YgfZ [Pseudomonadota bacterium]
MTHTSLTALPRPQIVAISGPDAIAFAQAQFSSDLSGLENGYWQWSAWLSAQGRVRAFFHLLRDDDHHLRLILRGGQANVLRDALARYVLRAKVVLSVDTNRRAFIERGSGDSIVAIANSRSKRAEYTPEQIAITLPGAQPRRLLLRVSDATPIDADDSAEALHENAAADIHAGLAVIDTTLEDRLLPTWLGLDSLDATSTRKGCYPGQEVVARLHFRGGNKRWLHRIAFHAERLPAPGETLEIRGGMSAQIVQSTWTGMPSGIALAVIGEIPPSTSTCSESPSFTVVSIEKCEFPCT